jgi:hypothetical protein
VAAVVCALAAPSFGAPPTVTLRLVAGGFSAPVEIANAGDGSGRLFAVEQAGVIKVVKDGAATRRAISVAQPGHGGRTISTRWTTRPSS